MLADHRFPHVLLDPVTALRKNAAGDYKMPDRNEPASFPRTLLLMASIMVLASCVSLPPDPAPAIATRDCPDLSGTYSFESLDRSCKQKGRNRFGFTARENSLSSLPLPDETRLLSEGRLLQIEQTACDRIRLSVIGTEAAPAPLHDMTLDPGQPELRTSWRDGALVYRQRNMASPNVPAFAWQALEWSLKRNPSTGSLTYRHRSTEKGLYLFLIPFGDTYEVECTLRKVE